MTGIRKNVHPCYGNIDASSVLIACPPSTRANSPLDSWLVRQHGAQRELALPQKPALCREIRNEFRFRQVAIVPGTFVARNGTKSKAEDVIGERSNRVVGLFWSGDRRFVLGISLLQGHDGGR